MGHFYWAFLDFFRKIRFTVALKSFKVLSHMNSFSLYFRLFFAGFALFLGAFLFLPQATQAAQPVYTVNLLTPVLGDSLRADSISEITWEKGEGDASLVNLFYSVDGGFTWDIIVKNTINDGSYRWTVAHVQSDAVIIKVATTDLVEDLATDVSDVFSIWIYAEDNSAYWEGGVHGVEGVFSQIDGIKAGDFVSVEGVEGISYIDEGMIRRPFFHEEAYFTHEDSLDAVIEISQNTSNKFALGAPMVPQAGVVLIKTPSSNRVYLAREADAFPTLHWIVSEEIARDMFGSEWNSYIFHVDATLFTRYEIGEDIDESYSIDQAFLKRVDALRV